MKKLLCVWAVLAAGAAVLPPGQAGGQSSQEKPATVKITLYPAAAPLPALKYQLLPPFIEQRDANAAVIYGKVKDDRDDFFGNRKLQDKIRAWLEVPWDKFPKEEVRKEFNPPLHFLQAAARCQWCRWEVPIRDEPFYSIMLPEAMQARNFGRILALQARLHIAYHEYDKALEMLQAGYALGRQIAEEPILVSGLVGVAIHEQMFDRVLEMLQQPDAPNLCWALTALPRPMIDFHKALEGEMYAVYLSFPELRDLDQKDYPAAYWGYLMDKTFAELTKMAESGGASPGMRRAGTTLLILQGYPQAKEALIRAGRKAEDVEKMPVAQVVLLYTMHTYDELRDNLLGWAFLPYAEAKRGMEQADTALRTAAVQHREIFPLAGLVLPALSAVKRTEVRGEREIALLRVLSALRLYAFQHGRLPASLRDVTEVPLPADPLRNEPFAYQCRGAQSAVVEVLGPPGTWGAIQGQRNGARYEIELKENP